MVREGAHFEGGVIMTPEGRASSAAPAAAQAEPASPAPTKGSQSASQAAQGSIFSSKEREPAQAAERQTAPGSAGSS